MIALMLDTGHFLGVSEKATIRQLVRSIKENNVEVIVFGAIDKKTNDFVWEKQFKAVDVAFPQKKRKKK